MPGKVEEVISEGVAVLKTLEQKDLTTLDGIIAAMEGVIKAWDAYDALDFGQGGEFQEMICNNVLGKHQQEIEDALRLLGEENITQELKELAKCYAYATANDNIYKIPEFNKG